MTKNNKEKQIKDIGQLQDETVRLIIESHVKDQIEFSRRHKEGKIGGWHKNESMYYQELPVNPSGGSNLGVGNSKMHGFVETLLSKIDNTPRIRYVKAAEEDLMKQDKMNALIQREASPTIGAWGFKDILVKKDAILYGRGHYRAYGSHSKKEGFKFNLDPIDAYDFLIDPAAGGLSQEKADYLGYTGVWKSKEELQKGVYNRGYDKESVDLLISGGHDSFNGDEEEANKENRYAALVKTSRTYDRPNMYKFWEWYTTYNGVRYYVLFSERLGGKAIKITELKNMFKSNLYPIISYAVYPSLSEWWTPSPADVMRSIFIAQGKSINQMIDNSDRINYPQRIVRAGSVKNVSSLRWKKNRITTVSKNVLNLKDAVQTLDVPSTDLPIKTYDILETIGNTESGVSAGARGVAEEDKVGIYEGNIQQMADRLGLINKSYSHAYSHLGKLFYYAVQEHMTKETAIDVMGIEGVEHTMAKKGDLLGTKMYSITVESSDAEAAIQTGEKKARLTYLAGLKGEEAINQKVRLRMEGEVLGLTPDEIKQLQDVNNTANAKLMAECAQGIHDIIQGVPAAEVGENEQADTAFLQKIVDYMADHRSDLTDEKYGQLVEYYEMHNDIVIRNSVKKAEDQAAENGQLQQFLQQGQGEGEQGAQQGQMQGGQAPQNLQQMQQ